ncbi:hypothetical protein CMUS01_12963 [Colletotrichum musicola]|uniref:Uncharacterized protein n=1 Tax=Colletotrichum musicola TaxID=2175873 RepID=A0A8H6JGN8_9PEZI|nr:hypothetical protein CMUS01_12963 [Colletotrichum musicola]
MAAVLLSFLVIFFAFEFLVKKLEIEDNKVKKLQQFLPFGFCILGIILLSVLLTGNNERNCDQYVEIDADIGGPGIRFAVWAQGIVLLAIAIIGTFHAKATGIKEIGAGLAITHFSLAIALLVEMAKKQVKDGNVTQLNAADAILGAMILDSQNVALSIPLVTKETLASRWQVCAMVFCQAFGLVLTGILVGNFGDGVFPIELKQVKKPETCDSVRVVWWGLLSTPLSNSQDEQYTSPEMAVFWVYFTFRWLLCLHSSFHALFNMSIFHRAEKIGDPLKGITFRRLLEDLSFYERLWKRMKFTTSDTIFQQYPTTVSLMFVFYVVVSWGSLAAAEIALRRDFGDQPEHDFSVGQVIAVVVAGVTILRGLWLFSRMVQRDRRSIGWFYQI